MHKLGDLLENALDEIENRIKEDINADFLANILGFSSIHLQRLFKFAFKQPIKTYIRSRKLTASLDSLFNTNLKLIDIALEYGFEYEETYIKAFKREFGCTPGKARKHKMALVVRERILYDSIVNIGDGLMYGPEHMIVPKFSIVGIPTIFRDFDLGRDGFTPNELGQSAYFGKLIKLPNANSYVYYGLVRYLNEENSKFFIPCNFEYMPSVSVSSLDNIPKDLKDWTFPTGRYVRFRYIGEHPPEKINIVDANKTYNAVEQFFNSQDRYFFPRSFHYERIDPSDYDGMFCRMDLIYPVIDRMENSVKKV